MINVKILNNINEDEYFVLSNGRVLKNIYELSNSLTGMDDEIFDFHVNDEKNDFSNWIRHVFKDDELADKILKLKHRDSIIRAINKHVAKISNEVEKKRKKSHFLSKKPKEESVKPQVAKISTPKVDNNLSEHDELLKKVNDILAKEKEINKREEKIQEIEERLERKLGSTLKDEDNKFFTMEFIHGLVIGILISLIGILIYQKFFF